MSRNTRRKKLPNPHKSQLTFVEPPVNGDVHRYGPQPRSAINPRSFISEEQHQNSTAWVLPQFDQIQLPAIVQKRTRSGHSQSHSNTRYNSTCSRKSSTCKYPSLSFGISATKGLHCKNKGLRRETELDIIRETNQTSSGPGPSNAPAKVDQVTPRRTYSFRTRRIHSILSSTRTHEGSAENSKASSPLVPHMSRGIRNSTGSSETVGFNLSNEGNDLIPPDIDTPEILQKVASSSKCTLLHLLLPSTPSHSDNLDILVKDTPERDYGLKVTWRRRKEQMRLLMKRGQLSSQQVEVAAT